MRNTVSVFLMGIGVLIIAIGFIAGIGLGKDANGEFSLAIALYWWLSALAAGFLFIGLSEVVHLLQKLLDRSAGAAPSAPYQSEQSGAGRLPTSNTTAGGSARAAEGTGSYSAPANQARPEVQTETAVQHGGPARGVEQFKGLTILLDERKIKGTFRFGPELLQIVSQSMFQADEAAQTVETIPLHSFSADYLEGKDYYTFSFEKGTRKLAFKTHNLYDYDRIVKRIRREA
ncbi:hypothetical protein [Cohnella hashimotonis]|uniref:Uncharacterized protein n=1 Tax=Cohnella hashimotonis TaxID=2826895 RepID=A0ABT6TPC3_9BACL|nr:hypothetical protein [Cohnella hashimotonis]MDI4648675.1 hypothetical protein [Cohnella hashimotonis]